jgi:branched-chain amino acid transport system substrate-binding protein
MLKILLVLGNQENVSKKITKSDIINHRSLGAKRFFVRVKSLQNPTSEQFWEMIRNHYFDMIIIVGHSRPNNDGMDGTISINDNTDVSKNRISIEAFRGAFIASVNNGLKLVILAGCSGNAAARRLVANDINVPNVIAFKLPITPNLLRRFFEELFRHWIVNSEDLETAINSTRPCLSNVEQINPGAATIPTILSSAQEAQKAPLKFAKIVRISSWYSFLVSLPIATLFSKLLDAINFKSILFVGLAIVGIATAILIKPETFTSIKTSLCQKIPFCQIQSPSIPQEPPILESIGDRVLFKSSKYFSKEYIEEKERIAKDFVNQNYPSVLEKIHNQEMQLGEVANKYDPERFWTKYNALAKQLTKDEPGKLITIPVISAAGSEQAFSTASQAPRGAVVAQKEINERGGTPIKNLKILLRIILDDSDKDKAKDVALKIVKETNKPKVVIGHFESNASLEAAGIYDQNSVVMITPASTVTELHDKNKNGFIFRTVPTSEQMVKDLIPYIVSIAKGKKPILGFCYDPKTAAASSFRKALEKDNRVEILKDDKCRVTKDSVNGLDYNQIIQNMKENGRANGLVLYFHLNHDYNKIGSKAIAKFAQQKGGLDLYGNHGLDALETLDPAFNNMVIVSPAFGESKLEADFQKKFQAIYGDKLEPTWRDKFAYDAVKAAAYGLDQSDGTSKGLMARLRDGVTTKNSDGTNRPLDGANRIIKFNKNGDRFITSSILKVKCEGVICEFSKLK